jgi:hypothetical protein
LTNLHKVGSYSSPVSPRPLAVEKTNLIPRLRFGIGTYMPIISLIIKITFLVMKGISKPVTANSNTSIQTSIKF